MVLVIAALLLVGIWLGWLGQQIELATQGMVFVPEGPFQMGSDEGEVDERPAHQVYLSGYWIDRPEVSNADYARFAQATGYRTQAERDGTGGGWEDGWKEVPGADWQHPEGPDANLDGRSEHPVVQVSWEDARAYCEWVGKRLPTEAEWEKAARGADGRRYPWGAEPADGKRANAADRNTDFPWRDQGTDDGHAGTAPAAHYPAGASPYGAADLAGNVWEWVADWYGEGYYEQSPERDARGPEQGRYRVIRGGSWFNPADHLRTSYRNWRDPAYRRYHLGFRCARDP